MMWYELKWQEWVGVVGTGATLGGLLVATTQIKRTVRAAEAAAAARIHTQGHRDKRELTDLATQLERTVADVEEAVASGEVDQTRKLLDRWCNLCAKVSPIVREIDYTVSDSLGMSATFARTAVHQLSSSENLSDSTKYAREKMSKVAYKVSELAHDVTRVV